MKLKPIKVIKIKPTFLKDDIQNKMPIILCFVLISGILSGVLLESFNSDLSEKLTVTYNNYFIINSNKKFAELSFGYFLYNIIYIILPMLSGLCVIGFIMIYIFPFVKGIGIGSLCAYIFYTYGVKGVGYSLIIIIPSAIIQAIAIILSCNESYYMASDIFSVIKKENTAEEKVDINLFFLRYLIIILISLFSALTYGLCSKIYLNLFFD